MYRVHLLAFLVLGLVALTGCPKPPAGTCKSSKDCADQAGYGKICVQGQCQECSADSDCKPGFACQGNKCVPPPVATCDNATCPPGQGCGADGKCTDLPKGTCNKTSDCGVDENCVERTCRKKEAVSELPQECGALSAKGDSKDLRDARSVYFGFDQYNLTADAQSKLQLLAKCLKAGVKVTAAGYCDERGTAQYNIALGDRRANAVKKYLSDLGAGGDVGTVSYGKQKQVCNESNEACWSQNRRVELTF